MQKLRKEKESWSGMETSSTCSELRCLLVTSMKIHSDKLCFME